MEKIKIGIIGVGYLGEFHVKQLKRCENADIVFMCVGNDNDVRDVGTQALAAMKAGSVLVDHTTASADIARELYETCKNKQIGF